MTIEVYYCIVHAHTYLNLMCRDVTKGTLRREIKIEFCKACSRGHSTGHFDTKLTILSKLISKF